MISCRSPARGARGRSASDYGYNSRVVCPRVRQGFALPLFFLLCVSLSAQSDELALKSQRAKELMAAGRFADAIPIYEELCRAVPGNPGLLLNLALAEHMAGQHRKAIPNFEAVVKVQPGNVPALLSLGVAHLELGEAALAIA